MAALLGYQLLDYFLPKAGLAHIVCYSLYPSPPALFFFRNVSVIYARVQLDLFCQLPHFDLSS